MADELITLAELIVINDRNLADRNMTDLLNRAPLLARLPADTASNDTSHKYTVEDGAPVVGFRAANAGRDMSKSSDRLVSIDLKILDASFQIDKALADGYRFGPQAKIAREAMRHLRQGFFETEAQIINGTGNNEDGFTGLADEIDEDHDMFVSAGGSGSEATSVWLMDARADLDGVVAITGQDGELSIGDSVIIKALDGDGKQFPAWYTPISAWLGAQVGSARSVARIGHITDDAPLTDDLIAEALSLFPSGRGATLIGANRRALRQLRESRTATNATGAPAPFPTEAFNVELVTTDSIPNDETVPA